MYRQGPICGAYLDPGERCDGQDDPDDENKKSGDARQHRCKSPTKEIKNDT